MQSSGKQSDYKGDYSGHLASYHPKYSVKVIEAIVLNKEGVELQEAFRRVTLDVQDQQDKENILFQLNLACGSSVSA